MDVKHVASLANLTITPDEEKKFSAQFTETLKTVDLINELDTSKVSAVRQITGLTNITRPDTVDPLRILPVNVALSGAHKVHNNYFVVPSVFDAQ